VDQDTTLKTTELVEPAVMLELPLVLPLPLLLVNQTTITLLLLDLLLLLVPHVLQLSINMLSHVLVTKTIKNVLLDTSENYKLEPPIISVPLVLDLEFLNVLMKPLTLNA